MPQNTLADDHMQAVLKEVADQRFRRGWSNFFGVIGVLAVALLACLAIVTLTDPGNAGENITAILGCLLLPFIPLIAVGAMLYNLLFEGVITLAFACIPFWVPVILYFWSLAIDFRRRTLLSLLQTAIETGTPPAKMIRAHAAVCSERYGNRLIQLARSLENGRSLTAALNEHSKLVRYDVCGVLALGADENQTLKALEEVSRNTRDRTLTQANSVFRIAYLLALCFPMLALVFFVQLWIAPQFNAIFSDFGISLPPLTSMVFAVALPVAALAALFFPLVAIFLFLYLMMQSDTIASRPIFLRRFFRSVDAARFLRVFSIGLKNQVPIPDSIEVYRRVATSEYLKKTADKINKKIRNGGNWVDAFRKAHIITAGEARILGSAERAGNLTVVVDQIAESKDLKQFGTNDWVSKSVFIPSLLLIGGLVGLFVVGMFLPMIALVWSLASNI